MSGAVLQVAGLTKQFGGFVALQDVELHVNAGERLGLIGPNGSGKTTLINCISGALLNDAGKIAFEGRDITRLPPHQRTRLGIARTFQIPKPFRSMSVLDNLRVPLEYAAWSRADHGRITDEAMEMLELIGLQHRAQASSASLTLVDMRKLELVRALAAKPRLLVSDEAMAGLSASEVDDILALLFGLKEKGVAVIMIEHIMRAVMKFSDRLVVLVAGRKIADGEPQSVAGNADVIKAYLGE
jgi:branched-chain amino acid transport system ATP-binding protein